MNQYLCWICMLRVDGSGFFVRSMGASAC
ncbi:hypothetical protein A2U01_0109497, partial [Trifolium medium]|nr:hypothetical protein [Trifolium medium]